MTQDEIKRDLLQVCKVKGWDGDFNVLGFHVLCDKLKQLGAEEEREAMVAEAAKKGWGMRNDDPFEDCVREIADIRARGQPQVCCEEYNTCVRPCTPRGRHHGQKEEREACAKLVDHILKEGGGTWGDAIRARGNI